MISTQSELQGHKSHVSLGQRLEASRSSGSPTELLPLGQAAVLQIKALLGAIQESNKLRGRGGEGFETGQSEISSSLAQGRRGHPPDRPRHPSLGQAAWGRQASSADDLINHIKGWCDHRSAGTWQDAQGNLLS